MSIYSTIPAMACKCQHTAERDDILRQLEEWGVPKAYTLYPEDMLVEFSHVHVLETWEDEDWMSYNSKLVSTSDFLSAFREVYEASKRPKDNTIVFPSDEWLNSIFTVFDSNEIKIAMAIAVEKHKNELLKLNPHLKCKQEQH